MNFPRLLFSKEYLTHVVLVVACHQGQCMTRGVVECRQSSNIVQYTADRLAICDPLPIIINNHAHLFSLLLLPVLHRQPGDKRMGETKRVSKPMKKSSRHQVRQQEPQQQQQQGSSSSSSRASEVAEIHAVPDLLSARSRRAGVEREDELDLDLDDSISSSSSPEELDLRPHHRHHGSNDSCSAYFKLTGSRHNLRDPSHHTGRKVSDATKEEIQDDEDEASLRELLMSLQQQVTVMSMNLSSKLDELQSDRHFETTVALSEIRTQLQELTKSVESCQSEVVEVKRDMVAIKHELDAVQQVKEEIEELREYVDRLEEQSHRRKALLLRQGLTLFLSYAIFAAVLGMLQFGYNTGVINAPELNIENFMKDVYKDRFGEDIPEEKVKILYSIAVSIFAIGGMVGGFSGGMIANRFGRKGGLLLNNVLGIGGACLMGFTKISHSYEILFLGRFIIGVNC
ncbi:hypothetical protein B566_EDAN009967, partial [Ephemera danica]